MTEAYQFPASVPAVEQLDEFNVPLLNRDKCASHLIEYYKCLDKGTSFCATTKDQFYQCQYYLLKQRLPSSH